MNILKIIFSSLIPNFKVGYFELKTNSTGIPFKGKLSDIISVLRSTGFFLFLALIAAFVFLVISPGRDALLLVVEDAHSHYYGSLLSLLIGLFVWSVSSEFGVRYSIYVTDNSGKSLSAERVEFRKTLQRFVSGSCLLLPSVLVISSLIIIQFTETSVRENHEWLTLVLILFLVYWLLSILTHLYFHSYDEKDPSQRKKNWFFSSDKLPSNELYWTNKIYGIYNDYVFMLPKPGNYLDNEQKKLQDFSNYFEKTKQTVQNNFPQDKDIIIEGIRVPEGFIFEKFEDGGSNNAESFRWIYSIPLGFYKDLHKQVKLIFVPTFILLLIISLIPADLDILENMGAPGLLCGSFACWIGIYTGILYVDFARLRKSWFSLRAFLFALFLFSSYFNSDHPVRVKEPVDSPRMAFKTHFENWFTNYKKEVDSTRDTSKQKGKYPVVFICAEGGALRTGAYTAIFLDKLQDTLYKEGIDIKKSVYAMSGVSGGSLGLGYYNAANYINKPSDFKKDTITPAETFFLHDFLSPVIGKMFYGDLLNLFIPFHIENFDRAIALENSWEYAYGDILNPKVPNTFKRSFLEGYRGKDKTPLPLLLINTTEVESGNQCWITNVVPGDIIYHRQRDLLADKIHNSVNYSTAVNFSSRFPLFSPGGMLREKDSCHHYKLHYVDGGYYENTGAGSMFELLSQLKNDPLSSEVYPIIIYLRFSDNPANQTKDINFGNEIAEIVSGIYDTRNGRTYMAVQQLNELAIHFNSVNSAGIYKDLTGNYIDEPLSEDQRQVPMNWVLSKQSMNNIKTDVANKLKNTSDKGAIPIIENCKYSFSKVAATK